MELTLVGTGHIFRIGDLVRRIIDERSPDVVCVELDPVRLQGLEERRRLARLEAAGDPRAEEIRRAHKEALRKLPMLYRFMARTQERLATHEGVEAGSEMLAAVDAARARGLPLATIDVDAQGLIRRAWGAMSMGERFRFVWAMLRGQGPSTVEKEMGDYQEDPVAYIARVGDDFPTLKRVLIDERDAHMARAILQLERDRHRIPNAPAAPTPLRVVAVVGDGHVGGMLERLQEALPLEGIEVIRVGALRQGDVPASPFEARPGQTPGVELDDTGTSASFRIEHVPFDGPAEPSG